MYIETEEHKQVGKSERVYRTQVVKGGSEKEGFSWEGGRGINRREGGRKYKFENTVRKHFIFI